MLTYQLVPVLIDLSKLSEIVKTDVVENVYKAKIKNIENQIPDIINLATNASLNAKINDVKAEISNIINLAMNTVLTAVESIIIPNVSNLVKKSDYITKISEIENRIATDLGHDKHITTQKFNKLITENFTARLKQVNLASKNDIDNFINKTDFYNRLKDVRSNKNELNELSKKC